MSEHAWLDTLAEFLVARHVNASIPDVDLRREILDRDSSLWKQSQRKFRCIAVVGAGASAPVLARGEDLASSLIQKFNIGQAAVEAERERLRRITEVDPSEFEAQLSAIGQTLGNTRRVRAAISDLYRVRHPTILAYEFLAHLLKHRFIDAIISMNFDELLDQSLDDELGIGEYTRIVSDRDCVNIESNVFSPDYIPLYIKLHGSASEPESLLFTRESYYDSPVQVGTEAAHLFQVPECVVLNIGFGMTSFDLHRLLAIPDRLWLYNLSHDPLTDKAREAIRRERKRQEKGPTSFRESESNEEKRKEAKKTTEKDERRTREERPHPLSEHTSEASDQMMGALLKRIGRRAQRLSSARSAVVALRAVKRHRTVVRLLGPKSRPGKRLIDLPRGSEDPRLSLDPLTRAAQPGSAYAGYLLRRTILELALAMARGRGLVSVAGLAVDRGGLYYDAYKRCAGADPQTWRGLCTLVGFDQNSELPDVFHATKSVRKRKGRKTEGSCPPGDTVNGEWRRLPVLSPGALAERILSLVVDDPGDDELDQLWKTLKDLGKKTEYELHSRDDRVCAKTFFDQKTLKTMTALDAYTAQLMREAMRIKNANNIHIEIIAETGAWLREDKDVEAAIKQAEEARLIVAFESEAEELHERFPNLKIGRLQPWHHNRHITIVTASRIPLGAIYFARHHRTPYVTPILLRDRRDVEVLKTTFADRWHDADKC